MAGSVSIAVGVPEGAGASVATERGGGVGGFVKVPSPDEE
jgi:hypothetical protein